MASESVAAHQIRVPVRTPRSWGPWAALVLLMLLLAGLMLYPLLLEVGRAFLELAFDRRALGDGVLVGLDLDLGFVRHLGSGVPERAGRGLLLGDLDRLVGHALGTVGHLASSSEPA